MRRVLLVDDEEDLLEPFESALQLAGYEVVATKSPEVALEHLAGAEPGRFSLAVIDLFLGGQTSGFQIAREVADTQPGAGILIISGFLRDEVPRHSLPRDRVEFISKPITLDELVEAADRLTG